MSDKKATPKCVKLLTFSPSWKSSSLLSTVHCRLNFSFTEKMPRFYKWIFSETEKKQSDFCNRDGVLMNTEDVDVNGELTDPR